MTCQVPGTQSGDHFPLRVLMFIGAVPFFVALIFVLPYWQFAALSVSSIVAAVLAAREVSALFARGGVDSDWWLAGVGAAVFPASAFAENLGWVAPGTLELATVLTLAAVLVGALVRASRRGALELTLHRATATLFAALYPGLFIAYIVRMAGLPQAQWVLLTFFVAVYGNDTVAYLAGKLARGRTALGLRASPSKTAVGYAAGLSASVAWMVVARALFPAGFPFSTFEAVAGGLAIGSLAALGDLVESALKRAARVKDSGTLIPGRGGLLDSIDSLLLAAPPFYYWIGSLQG